MNQTWNPAQDGQADVDEEIGATAALEEDRQLQDMSANRVSRRVQDDAVDGAYRRDEDSDEVVDDIGR